ncbi:class I adenylate-forming enzyme family protein [Caldisphaera sp.]|uniref:class I adenylate-forming enzyme family protein n=1 Tax=Caldisphaera sp. TaxID=2060322 RepID=UPI003D149D7B
MIEDISFIDKPIFKFFDEISEKNPDQCSLIQLENYHCITWHRMKILSDKIADFLLENKIMESQILFSAHNTIDAVIGLLGIMKSNNIAVLVDPLTISEDLKMEVEDKNIKFSFVSWQFYEREAKTLKELGIEQSLVLDGQVKESEETPKVIYFKDILSKNFTTHEKTIDNLENTSVIMYYAGIAGRTLQTYHSYKGLSYAVQALSKTVSFDFKPNSLVIAPITHVLGLQVSLLVPLFNEGTAIMLQRWDPKIVKNSIKNLNINFMSAAPMSFDSLIDEITQSNESFKNTIKLGISAGAPLKPETQEKFVKIFDAPLVQSYGMTESWVVTYQPKEFSYVKNTLGLPIYGAEVKIVDPTDPEKVVNKGETGELLVKAPWLMKGYEDNEETKKAFHNDYLKTGDLVSEDDKGFLYFKGVKKRMLKYKAYPIFPKDIENVLLRHEAVKSAYVYGEKDPDVGDLPVAKVILKEEYKNKIKEEDLINYVNSKVAFYKKIRKVYFVDSL